MKIAYANSDIEAVCRYAKQAARRFGPESAKKLQRRLAELHAAHVVGELVAGRPHPLIHDRDGEFALDLHGGDRLIFKPTTEPLPRKPDGSIAWVQVTEVTIIEIGDYHD